MPLVAGYPCVKLHTHPPPQMRNYKEACSRRCLLFSRGLCVHICTALKRVPARHGGPLKWEELLPREDTMEAWDA